jgi:predicted DNA-binding transcriptional regulator YafY
MLRQPDSDAHAISIIIGLIAILVAIPFALIEKSRKDKEAESLEQTRIASIEALETQDTQPENLKLPRSASKYRWAQFYVQRPVATFIYLKTNGARMQRQARMVALGIDENGDGILGCFESGQFRVFYVDRIKNLTPTE